MKKLSIILVIFLSLSIFPCEAQVKMSELLNTTWRYQSGDNDRYDFRITFTKDSILHYHYFKTLNRSTQSSFAYYLTSAQPKAFCNSLIGKTTEGNYIAEYEDAGKRLIWYKITLEKDTLTLVSDDHIPLTFERK